MMEKRGGALGGGEEENRYLKIQRSIYSDGGGWLRGSLLGEGGFGSVFVAILPDQPRPRQFRDYPSLLAVKSAWSSSSAELTMEKLVYDRLGSSPHIIKCYGHDYTLPEDYERSPRSGEVILNVFLENAFGGSLRSLIKRSSATGLRESQARAHTRSVLRGLELIHQKGFVHCDLKPANILLVPCDDDNHYGVDGFVAKIADLGLAKRSHMHRQSKSKRKAVRGTLMYLSPEAVLENMQEQASDIWALGCVVLEMLTGSLPWDKRLEKEELLRKIGTETPALPFFLTKTARDFLVKCFTRNPNERPSAEMLLTHPFAMESLVKPQELQQVLLQLSAFNKDIGHYHHHRHHQIINNDDDDFIPLGETESGCKDEEEEVQVVSAAHHIQIMPVALMHLHTQDR
ncbi:mitogen-activated protein kinase kinase kinase 20-like [Humulus lupulus]|uniref:mitogen-activated protein kinase kinase kinase 20-like n=1 Tax=Humulus lupulus TaxID=3486 RepID=UPI002B40FC89|nr:mitogen-activated protein kinase kinase kinase 20-like [Humulus lupulus]XP_062104744.1 mitogen-activated protein kinase kinase kinase 20-like [Humulus lupulus]XP_062104745.1 mitogen-activated protein kinase kinase kinase 20-like [Humulus lupulus]XP_062104746.1 mitogen-activated protein kinase kinase kinase 20-like [Humulus lupulus]XP_062104747.1 mitogen-activated protein kinase kinase kinase 20-like [Humulus lupulus]